MQHVADDILIIAVAVVEHAHGIGGCAIRLTLGVVHVPAQVSARITVITQMIVTLTYHTIQFRVKVVVLLLGEEFLAALNDIVIMFPVILNLSEVILGLVTQFGVLGNAAELGLGLGVITLGIIQICLIELAGTSITLGVVQLIVLPLGLLVVAEAQVAIGTAILQVLVAVEVQRVVTHHRIAQQGTLPLATIEVVVTQLQLCLHGQWRCGIIVNKTLQGHQAGLLAAFKVTQGDVVIGLFTHRRVIRQLFDML